MPGAATNSGDVAVGLQHCQRGAVGNVGGTDRFAGLAVAGCGCGWVEGSEQPERRDVGAAVVAPQRSFELVAQQGTEGLVVADAIEQETGCAGGLRGQVQTERCGQWAGCLVGAESVCRCN